MDFPGVSVSKGHHYIRNATQRLAPFIRRRSAARVGAFRTFQSARSTRDFHLSAA